MGPQVTDHQVSPAFVKGREWTDDLLSVICSEVLHFFLGLGIGIQIGTFVYLCLFDFCCGGCFILPELVFLSMNKMEPWKASFSLARGAPSPKETPWISSILWEVPGAISMPLFQCSVTSLEKYNFKRISESYSTSKKM